MFRAVFIFQDNSSYNSCLNIYEDIKKEIKEETDLTFYEVSGLDDNAEKLEECRNKVLHSHFVFISLHGGVPYFRSYLQIRGAISENTPFYFDSGIEDEVREIQKKSPLSASVYHKVLAYHKAGGEENYTNMLRCILYSLGAVNLSYGEVKIPQREGIYNLPSGMTEEEMLSDFASYRGEKVRIGILVHYHCIQNRNDAHIKALVSEAEKKGKCLAFYTNIVPENDGTGGLLNSMNRYLVRDGHSIVDVLIVTSGFSMTLLSDPGDGKEICNRSIFEALDIPVLQASMTQHNYSAWREAVAGMDSMYLCANIYQPEFDGQIITSVIATTEKVKDRNGMREVYQPVQERIERIVRLACNWGRLRKIPAEEKKVAILFHNMPPRVDLIGCAYGLDSPAAVFNMYKRLKEAGIKLDFEFKDGKDIIDRIIAGVTNDRSFLSVDEMEERCQAFVPDEVYREWFDSFSDKDKAELERDWGEAPGEVMHCKKGLMIPGIINGNLFIGLQPQRAFGDKAEEMYHSTDLVCPHQYIAFYRYLEKIFGANVIVHTGTHGTIEWLPGKETALSEECYPDIAIGDLPNLYPYIIDVPGEGCQAKRRTSAVILEHLIPSMTEAGLYGPYEFIDQLMDQYGEAKLAECFEKLPVIAGQIADVCEKEKLFADLKMTREEFIADPDTGCDKVHVYLTSLKSMKIKDGLHIFGEAPAEERMRNMLRLLVCLDNGKVPSLRVGLCEAYGLELEELLTQPGKISKYGKSNLDMLDMLDEKGAELFITVEKSGYDLEKIDECIATVLPEAQKTRKLRRCIEFVISEVKPSLEKTTDELRYFEKGVRGEFVAPGQSGAPSRGNAEILPTGKNFFAIDPTTVPSMAAWETGKLLGDGLIEKYMSETGKAPENVAVVVYSGDTMKTHGDTIAEIMYLYGVRPVWIENTDRVIGLEIIPAEEMTHPRIDVTLRISGLFRDTFPNLIERIEDAVNMVAVLDEPEEFNFVKKHISEEMQELMKKGLSEEEAYETSSVRVFGCPPGTYGAGVIEIINSKQWKDKNDLGNTYITWSGHGYTKKLHGKKMQETFAKRLSTCDVTVKNIVSHEHDMLDDDCYVSYHGGLISAVTSQKGSAPVSINASSADPKHVETNTIQEKTAQIVRARITNPAWINGLKRHGFRGAQEFSSHLDIFYGWDATSSVGEDWMYDKITETYMLDEENREWIRENNPYALKNMAERLLEADMRGMWNCPDEMREQLREIYLELDSDLEGK